MLAILRIILAAINFPFVSGLVSVLLGVLFTALTILVSGAMAVAIGKRFIGAPSSIAASYQVGEGRFSSLLITTLLFAVIEFLLVLVVIGIPVAIYFGVRWALYAPVAVLEGTPGGMPTLNRSANLVTGHWWRTLGVLVVAAVIVFIISVILSAILGAIFHSPPLVAFLAQIISIVAIPFQAGVSVLLYFDYKVRKEGFDVANLESNIASLSGA